MHRHSTGAAALRHGGTQNWLAKRLPLLKPTLYRNASTGPFALAAKSLAGTRPLLHRRSLAGEIAAMLELAHAVKARPGITATLSTRSRW